MKKLKTIALGLLIGLIYNCDMCYEPQTIIQHDTIYVTDSMLFAELKLDFLLWRDSVDERKKQIIDSLANNAFDEVTIYRDESIYQIDTMRANFLLWMEKIKGLQIHGNIVVNADTTCGADVMFDEEGKPYLKID